MKNKLISERLKPFKKVIKTLFEKIEEFDRIVIYRHNKPDYDALGTQLGLYEFLKTNYPEKEVHFVGDDSVSLTGQCFRQMEILDDSWFNKPFLAIFVDTSQSDRVGLTSEFESFKKATYSIKIDHHPNVDPYGDLQIIDTEMSAAGELVADILIQSGKEISKEAASELYKAIVGDSGRFLYDSVVPSTFETAKILLQKGLDLSKIYAEMYNQKLSDLEITAYVLKNYHVTKHGVAYYVLDDAALQKFHLPPERGKDNVNVFAHFDGIHAWCSITEDKQKGEWRVSIRSAKKSIEEVAMRHHGGGHAQASGCKIKSFDEVKDLLEDLDNLFA